MKNIPSIHYLQSKKFTSFLILFSISMLVAFLCHLFFVSEWFDGRYMTGTGDGLSQMIPFKMLLYEQYTTGNFFYSNQFGMGGGTYSQLGYYFSTSIIFLITVGVTFLLESTHLIQNPDLFYWADLILVVSIIRLSLILSVTTIFFRYMNIERAPAFIGAVLYGTSMIYFRHVTYWEFFADAMLWLPLLLIGIEKIIKEKKPGWFIVAVSLSFFDNFYFAYINILVAGIYIVFRWLIPLTAEETSKLEQVKMYIVGGLGGVGISAVSFIPTVYGYLNNHRIPYEGHIPLFGVIDNLLLDSRIVALPGFVVLCLFISTFYKKALFRFFACLTILSIMFHFSPWIGSVFNGFSAPQYRWEYFLSLTAGGVAAVGIQNINRINKRQVFISIACTIVIYAISYMGLFTGFRIINKGFTIFTLKVAYLGIGAIVTIVLFAIYQLKKSQCLLSILSIMLVMISIYTSNVYQMAKLSSGGSANVSKELMNSEEYNGESQLKLIDKIKERESDSFYRIDWMIGTRNNTPIVQNFNGFSVYSSILNKHLLYYYLYDLEIDMGRESVSRYMTLGDRANLYSILSGKYYIAEKDKKAIPFQFEEIFSVGNYTAYENKNILPFFRTTNIAYAEDDFVHESMIAKERAMITGIILNKAELVEKKSLIPESENLMDDVAIHLVDAIYVDNQLEVKGEIGGIDLSVDKPSSTSNDYYVSFYLKRLDKDLGFSLKVNDYVTSRKKNSSIYKTGVDKLTIRVSGAERISIRVPKGTYELANIELYEEDYQLLQSAKRKSEEKLDVPISWIGNKVKIEYNNEANKCFATLPIPYEKGWALYVNGQKSNIFQANYAFIGLLLEEGMNHIELVYYPPYFMLSVFITLVSLVVVTLFLYRKKAVPYNR